MVNVLPLTSRPDPGQRDLLDVSLVIPAHNESRRITSTLHMYGSALWDRYGSRAEIIVVANGCEDDTVPVVRRFEAAPVPIRVVDVADRIGKGGAIRVGFRAAEGDAVVFADADGATTPASLMTLMDDLDEHDVVIGSRRLPDSVLLRRQGVVRRAGSQAFNLAVRLLFGLQYRDTQCGAKAFRRDAARRLSGIVEENHWTFDVDLLLSARNLGLRIAERPVVWADVQGSHVKVLPTAVQVLQSLSRIHARQRRQGGESGITATHSGS